MKSKRVRLLLFIIVIFGSFWRLYQLPNWPSGLTPDEAAQAYSAYSILKTGRDEWGVRLPLNLRSFGDYKPPLQTYLMIPSIATFGLNEFALRLPNAILSSLSIIGVFFVSYRTFRSIQSWFNR